MDQTAAHSLSAEEAAPEYAVEIRDLTKVYGKGEKAKRALDNISLAIPRGSFFGLLGPNGAGKSTLINIMAQLVVKTTGTVRIWGHDIDRDPRNAACAIGVVPQELNLDPFFCAWEAIDVQAGFYGIPKAERRTDEILAAVGLTDKARAYARTLSGGMRRRMLVGKALVHSPPVLVLDEPTAGVDIELRQQLWQYVRGLNRGGVTVLLTTHYLEEAEELCDRIAIINRGKVVACDPTETLLARLDSKTLIVRPSEPLAAVPAVLAPFEPELQETGRLVFRYKPSSGIVDQLLAAVREAGIVIADVSTEETDLADIFLQLTRADSGIAA